jgi:hypothetical protein
LAIASHPNRPILAAVTGKGTILLVHAVLTLPRTIADLRQRQDSPRVASERIVASRNATLLPTAVERVQEFLEGGVV